MAEIELDAIADVLARLRYAQDQARSWADEIAVLRSMIEDRLGEHETGTIDGLPVVRWSSVTANVLSQSLLKANHRAAYDACVAPRTSRRFVLVDPA